MFSDITPAKIGFIGLGLIGGSVAKAIRTYFPDYELIAFDKNKETLALAVQENIIDTSCSAIDDNFKGCSYIFLCAPVSYNTACLTQLKSLIDPDCILTDVGSVKTSIHEEIISLGMEENFIGGHPMAGSEKNGFANSKAHLIENAYYILTPSAKVSEEKINAYRNFVSSLKALPIVLDYRQHDCITGTISHLPHIIASTLVNFVRDTDTKEELMKALAAGGFKDITRIASSSPVMWQQICLKNGKNISHILGQYIEALIQAKLSIDTEDEMRFILYLNLPAIIVILCLTPRQGRSKNSLPYTVILLMKPEESRRSQLYWQAIISVLKISALSTTANLKKAYSESNFMMNPPLPKLLRC